MLRREILKRSMSQLSREQQYLVTVTTYIYLFVRHPNALLNAVFARLTPLQL